MAKRKTTEEFINSLSKREDGGLIYNYEKVNYINNQTKITIICNKQGHGEFQQSPANHLRDRGCPECGKEKWRKSKTISFEEFKLRANKVHGGKYSYPPGDYINTRKKITIFCPKKDHGNFLQTPNSHLADHGCPACANELNHNITRFSFEEFVVLAREVHGEKYLYPDSNYINSKTKLAVFCPKMGHGNFWATPALHIHQKNGCPICANEARTYWTALEWVNAGAESIHFHSYKFYIIKLLDFNLYKPGITFTTLKKRFRGIPSKINIIDVVESKNGEVIYNLEQRVHELCAPYKKTPPIKFGGMAECVTSIDPALPLLY